MNDPGVPIGKFDCKVVIVTEPARGLGRACAERLTGRSMDIRQTTTAAVCLDADEAARPAPRSRQIADSNAVVHAVRAISLAEDSRQGDPGLISVGNPANVGKVDRRRGLNPAYRCRR
jgi:NAD(P)-dependent dehydrogenase (short-subunit alcohol dehydrogenase family)